MKVLLIQPPYIILKTESRFCHPPLGLAYLAAVLEKGHDVQILDCIAEGFENVNILDKDFKRYGLSEDKIKRSIQEINPDVVGVSNLFTAQAEEAHRICRIAKEADPSIVTIMGGAHPSAMPELTFRDSNVDFIVIGEGEITLKHLLETIEKGKDVNKIKGVAYREDEKVLANIKDKFIDDLDSLPFPLWKKFPLKKYFTINTPHGANLKRSPFLPVITSRGCPNHCTFCSVHNIWGRKSRKRSADNVLSELEYIVSEFGVKEILFEDDNLTLDKERAKAIFKGIIDRNFDLTWSTPNGLSPMTLDDELLELMKESGCHSISVAIESGDERVIREVIKKPLNLERVEPVLKKAKQLGLEISVFFVVGMPGEQKEELERTFRMARNLPVDHINFFFATPLPGTELFDICVKEHLIDESLDFRKFKSNLPVFSTKEINISDLNSLVRRQKVLIHTKRALMHPIEYSGKITKRLIERAMDI
jgi:magnesium-protoporphyrin IX monomethyl ester (oxidative) cyclase